VFALIETRIFALRMTSQHKPPGTDEEPAPPRGLIGDRYGPRFGRPRTETFCRFDGSMMLATHSFDLTGYSQVVNSGDKSEAMSEQNFILRKSRLALRVTATMRR
jgi:hypothetical protein